MKDSTSPRKVTSIPNWHDRKAKPNLNITVLREFLFELPLACAYVDSNLTYSFTNRAHQIIWNRSEEEIVGRPVVEVIGSENFAKSRPHIERAISGERNSLEVKVDFPGAGPSIVKVDFIPHRSLQGKLLGCFVVCDNLTEQKRVELERLKYLEKYQSLYNHTPAMLHSIDRSGRIVSVSKYWLEVLGYNKDEVLGRLSTEFLTEESAKFAKNVILPEFYRTGFCKDVPYNMLTKRGEVLDVLLSAIAERNENGEIERSVAVIVDVTNLKRAEAEKKELESQLRHAQKMEALGTLAGGIAHDFNNILSGIIGYSELALGKIPKGSALGNYLEQVHSSAYRAKNLVQQILTFSQRAASEKVPVRIGRVIDEIVSLAKATFQAGVRVHHHSADPDLHIIGDATQLHQVLLNILTNAYHAVDEMEGEIEIYAESVNVGKRYADSHGRIKPGPYVRVTISDNGRGMNEEVKKRIFEPYFTTKKSGQGSGLGLSVCHGIVANHGGTISVWSKPGKGARFAIYLPQVFAMEYRTPESAPAHDLPSDGRIMFIDDEPMLAQLGADMLSALGYQVMSFSNATEALQVFLNSPDEYDLIVTDLSMPGINGAQLVREVRAMRADIPIILSTGYGAKHEQENLGSIDLLDFLSKPFSLNELRDAVNNLFCRSKGN